MVEGDAVSTSTLVTAAVALFVFICGQASVLFLYLNNRINSVAKDGESKIKTAADEGATARREANEMLSRELGSQNADVEDLKRNAARHEDLAKLEARFMSVVLDLRDGIKEIGRKVESSSTETIKTLARLEARMDIDKESRRP